MDAWVFEDRLYDLGVTSQAIKKSTIALSFLRLIGRDSSCAVKEKLGEDGSMGVIVMAMVLGTIGACVLLDRWGIEDTWCCRRQQSADEMRAMASKIPRKRPPPPPGTCDSIGDISDDSLLVFSVRGGDALLEEAEALAREEALEEKYGKGKVPSRLRVRVGDHPLGMGAGEDDDVDQSCGLCSAEAGAAAAMELELAAIQAAMLPSPVRSEYDDNDDEDESDYEDDDDGDETMTSSADSTELRGYEEMGRLAAEKAKPAGVSPQKQSPSKSLADVKGGGGSGGGPLPPLAESPRSRLHQRLAAVRGKCKGNLTLLEIAGRVF